MKEITTQSIKNSKGREILARFLSEKIKRPELLDTFDKLTEIYQQVNSVINISALRTPDDIYVKHYLDSIYPYELFSGNVCDVGCGGGFPCLPLAIVTGLTFTGLDSVGKKLTLIRRCITQLGIKNITTEHSRSEDLAKKGKTFDTVCARALADSEKAIAFCAPLVAPGGKLILYRTQNDEKATKAIQTKYGIYIKDIIDYTLPETDINRRIFIYEKQ